MRAVKVQFASWDKVYFCDPNGLEFSEKDQVVIKAESGNELALVVGFEEVDPEKLNSNPETELKYVLRLATADDLEKIPDEEKKASTLADCKKMVQRYGLDMKLVDILYSLDGSRLTIAFIADGRVDFRDLVKELTRTFNRTIRLQQIGIRDEARICGDCGHCGKPLCCKSFIKDFISITSDMAEVQQCEHRGSDRISGCCGRLMCCLSYEVEGYKDMAKAMPPIGATVNVDGKRGEIIGHHYLKRSVNVKFKDEDGKGGYTIVEVDLDRNKKKDKTE